jgi:CPA2 family monovalent cation:H+ antiporter-2
LFAGAAALARPERAPQLPAKKDEPPQELEPTKLSNHAVLVGYGRVGKLIAQGLGGIPLLAIEEGAAAQEALRAAAIETISGNAAQDAVLHAANLQGARLLFVAIPEAFEAGQIVQQARKANPALPIIARAHFDAEVEHLLSLGATQVVMGEREIAHAMLDFALAPKA